MSQGERDIMARQHRESESSFEELLAELTDAAYQAALRQRPHGSFIDLELALWRDLRQVLRHRWDGEESASGEWSSWQQPVEDEDRAGLLAGRR
jgi:hypothetical protein